MEINIRRKDMKNYNEEKQNVIDWLCHPSELGKAPAKIEFTKEFTDEDGIECMIFKYKKSVLSPWMLAISSDSGVFSEMQRYNEKTEVEDAKKLIDYLKDYWKMMARSEQEKEERDKNADGFQAFVLMENPDWNPEKFEEIFSKDWGIQLIDEDEHEGDEKEESNVDARIYDVDSMRLVLGYMGFAIPEGEAEYNAQFNYMWKDAVDAAKRHDAHMLVTVMGEGTALEKGTLYTKAVTSMCKMESVVGVYANGVVYEPDFWIKASEMLEDRDIPLLNLIWFGLARGENNTVSAYTCGMRCFGRDEMEIINSSENPEYIRDMIINLARYVLTEQVILHDGETIGFTPGQRIALTMSEGVNVDGESLKIEI